MDRLTSENWTGNGGGAPPPSCSNDIQALTPGNVSLSSVAVCSTPGAPSSVPAFSASWTYDASGNRLTKTVNGQTSSYAYDELNRLTVETPPAPGVQITYGYSKNGNQLSRTQGSTVETWGYDYENRVSSYQKGSSVAYLYRYAPTGERLAKVNLLVGNDNEEWFMYDGQDATADYLRSSSSPTYGLQRTYVNGRAIDSKIARIEAPAPQTMYYYLGDALGTVHEIVDIAGAVVSRVLNTAWGENLPGFTPTSTVTDRHGFTQRERDDESGLQHFRARSYDPRLGRFVQKDPEPSGKIGLHYSYLGNWPTGGQDPSGRVIQIGEKNLDKDRQKYFYLWFATEWKQEGKRLVRVGDNAVIKELLDKMISTTHVYKFKTDDELIDELLGRAVIVETALKVARSCGFSSNRVTLARYSGSLPAIVNIEEEAGLDFLKMLRTTDLPAALKELRTSPQDFEFDCATGTTVSVLAGYVARRDSGGLMAEIPALKIGGPVGSKLAAKIFQRPATDEVLPGDLVVFKNGALRPMPGFTNENAIYVGGGKYAAHGISTSPVSADHIIKFLDHEGRRPEERGKEPRPKAETHMAPRFEK